MSFNLGISNHPTSRLGGLSSIGVYLYEDVYYRQWITEIALAFYEGRQDEFVWLDLVRQFRNPEKQQILPVNLTKEIIDETSILYKEAPIYRVVDGVTGKPLPKEQKLWEDIMIKSRYLMTMDKLDRWTKLLGTVLVKVSFVDETTGFMVNKNEGGTVQLDLLHGGVYDIRHGASPYHITELLVGLDGKFAGFPGAANLGIRPKSMSAHPEQQAAHAQQSRYGSTNSIYWSPTAHKINDPDQQDRIQENPYGLIPAVPFFNSDPNHYYFLPINEPLIYANHATNMRITDLNHIAKYQSFGVPVLSGVERPTGTRQGRPVDDFNQLRGGLAQSRFGGVVGGNMGVGAGGSFRNFDSGFGAFRDGNADANALGFSIGPDTAIAVGEKGDFKFEHPKADINGLLKTIESMTDIIRVNHGLRPKYKDKVSPSGFALWLEKSGVIDENRRRGQIFREREQQLFQVIKKLWNVHYSKSGERKFSENAILEITYVEPKFPVDPKTQMETLIIENKILDAGDRESYKKLYPYLSEQDIDKLIKKRRKDKEEQMEFDTELSVKMGKKYTAAGLDPPPELGSTPKPEKDEVGKVKIDNRAKHSEKSSVQPKKNGDQR